MRSMRCLHNSHHKCTGSVYFGDITKPPETWELVVCQCECHAVPGKEAA